MIAGLLEVAVTDSVWPVSPGPALMPYRLTVRDPESSLTVIELSGLSVGGSLTPLIVTVKLRVRLLLILPPSLMVTEMVTGPLRSVLALGRDGKSSVPVALGLLYVTEGVGMMAVLLEL